MVPDGGYESTFDVEIKMDLHFTVFILKSHPIGWFVGLTTLGDMQRGYSRAWIDFRLKFHSFSDFDFAFIPDDAWKRISIDHHFGKSRLSCWDRSRIGV